MKKENSQIRLKRIMEEQGLRQVDILEKSKPFQNQLGIKMSKTHLSNYINGKSNPDQSKLVLLSKTLGVSEPWLMGYDVPRNDSETHSTNETLNRSPLVDEISNVSLKLEEPRQKIVLETANAQLNEQIEEEKRAAKVVPLKKKRLTDEELWDVIEHGVANDGTEQTDHEKQFFFNLLREHLDNDDEYED